MAKYTAKLTLSVGLLLLAVLFVPAQKRQLDPQRPADVIRIGQKTNCSTSDGTAAVYWWRGRVYSRVEGERDRHIFNVQGFNLRTCQSFNDPKRGPGYRSVSREMLIYFDKDTGQVLHKWKNLWTNEEVDVLHVANDPVNMREPAYAYDKDGKPAATAAQVGFVKDGKIMQGGGAARLFYKNPLGGEYQENIGGWYHAMEFLASESNADDVLDADAAEVKDRVITWVRVSKWLPWMKMGDKPGVVIFHTAGMRLDSWDEMPEEVKAEVKANWPAFQTPPPKDDPRPSMTSWDQFKRWADEKKNKKP